ncbi:MAG: peptidase domain-containing ABC transporter [Pseudomonadota bacterium]
MSVSQDALRLLDFTGGRKLPLIRQTEAAECGLACLAMLAGYHGLHTDLPALRRRFSISLKGMTLQTLMAMADKLGLASRPLKAEMAALGQLRLPAVLHWDMNHFVVLRTVTRKGITVHDPALGERRYDWQEASKHYTGVAIEMQPTDGFAKADERGRLRLSQLWSRMRGFKRALIQLLALSAVLQLFVLVSPFYVQLVIDEVLTKFDTDLLVVLAIGFGLFTLIYVAANALRARLVLYIGGMMSYQMMINLFRHLIRLPQDYFDKRHIGDIDSRFGSTMPIKTMLTEGLIAGIIDGAMALTTLAMMLVYAPLLAIISFAAFAFNVGLRLGLYRRFRRQSEDAILAKAKEHTNFIETVRGILPIKLYGREPQRQQVWQNLLADLVNTDVRVGKTKIFFEIANKLLFGLENIAIIYLAARAVLASEFTIGMIFAFLAYKTLFAEKAMALVDRLLEFRMLDLHLERIADIALTQPEPEEKGLSTDRCLEGRLALRDITFRYADFEPTVLDGVNFHVAPGEAVAITGASGCGKTTMLKVMLGLVTPQAGEVLVDGLPLAQFGIHAFRGQVAAVMQDDRLFAGSLAENIAFFDPDIDMAKVADCASKAAIHDEILAMPMGYETLVGDMGTVLSGGQKQRILLARALYREPRVLFLDEGTAHLDMAAERKVNQAIAALGITRVIIAHRLETVQSAGRLLVFRGGKLVEVDPKTAWFAETGSAIGLA